MGCIGVGDGGEGGVGAELYGVVVEVGVCGGCPVECGCGVGVDGVVGWECEVEGGGWCGVDGEGSGC